MNERLQVCNPLFMATLLGGHPSFEANSLCCLGFYHHPFPELDPCSYLDHGEVVELFGDVLVLRVELSPGEGDLIDLRPLHLLPILL